MGSYKWSYKFVFIVTLLIAPLVTTPETPSRSALNPASLVWSCTGRHHGGSVSTIGALIIAYTILGAPYSNYGIMGPETLF